MRVVVDRDRCEGNAVCVGVAPEIFDLDADDYVLLKTAEVPAEFEAAVEQAIAECPRAALSREG